MAGAVSFSSAGEPEAMIAANKGKYAHALYLDYLLLSDNLASVEQ